MRFIRSLRITLLALVILALIATLATAQQPRIVAGPMAGVTFSTFSGDDVGPEVLLGSRTGFAAGGFVSFNANTHVAVEPQLLYVQKGASYGDGVYSVEYKLDYIEVPLLIKGRYWFGPEARPFTLDGFGGPAIAFNVHCGLSTPDFSSECGDLIETKTAELSVLFGAGLEYYGFSFQARCDLSMTNAFASTSSGEPDAKNRSWMLTLGYKIPVR